MQLHHRRYHQHRWRASSGGAEHVRGAFEALAGRLAAGAGGHSGFHAQGKGRPVGLKSISLSRLGETQWVWQSLPRASNARSTVASRISFSTSLIAVTRSTATSAVSSAFAWQN